VAKAGFTTKALRKRIHRGLGGEKLGKLVNSYMDDSDPKKSVIGPENASNWASFL